MTTLGSRPTSMSLQLVAGADFLCTLVSQSGDWPATADISIEVGTETWAATITAADAAFNVDQNDVDAMIAQAPTSFRLWYVDGATRLLWGAGSVLIANG